jgi:hypothetical protein
VSRILDLDRDQLAGLRGRELTTAVAGAEGRTIVAEVIAGAPGLADGVENLEIVASLGADVIILNFVERVIGDTGWRFQELGSLADLSALAGLIGRPIAVNLEPGDGPDARRSTRANARRLVDAGAAMLCLTANPGTGTSLDDLAAATADIRAELGADAAIWAGKMHHAGRAEELTADGIERLVAAGADGVLVPLPGTVPGITRERAIELVRAAHAGGAIVMGTIGTSQEGARPSIASSLALLAKEIGVDAHHLGDAGIGRVADPDLLYEYSIAVRGRRHTWRRMAFGCRQKL